MFSQSHFYGLLIIECLEKGRCAGGGGLTIVCLRCVCIFDKIAVHFSLLFIIINLKKNKITNIYIPFLTKSIKVQKGHVKVNVELVPVFDVANTPVEVQINQGSL